MFSQKIRWYTVFESVEEFENLFALKNSVVHKSMFGEVLLVKTDSGYRAFKNKCPHQNKPLNDSWIDEGHIVCPYHQYHYSIETGRGHGMCLDKYHFKIENGQVMIGKEVWTLF